MRHRRVSRTTKTSVTQKEPDERVRVDDQGDAVAAIRAEVEVLLNVEGWIDHRGFARLARGDEVRRAAELVVEELLEVHPVIAFCTGGESDPYCAEIPRMRGAAPTTSEPLCGSSARIASLIPGRRLDSWCPASRFEEGHLG